MLKNYKPTKYISYLYFFIPILFSFFISINRESDIWFLLSHGRYVIRHGFPVYDILSMHSDFSFVMQQWLSSVLFYAIYSIFKGIGIFLLIFLTNLLILFFLYKLCLVISNGKNFSSIVVASFIDILLELNFIVPRPQIFSILVFIILLYILESFLKKKNHIIYFLPLLSLLLVNLHASMWPCFFIFCLPYLVEFVYLYWKNKDKMIFKFLIVIILSILCGFINPYSTKAMLYSFTSYGNYFINNSIMEMHSFNLIGSEMVCFNSYLLLIIFFVILSFIFYSKQKISLHQYFLLFGTFYMALVSLRNISLFLICSLPFISKYISFIDGRSNYKFPYKIYLLLFIIIVGVFIYNCNCNYYVLSNEENSSVLEYLDKNTTKSIKLYTNFWDGAYYEYYGYRPYIDSRAEIYFKMNNKKEDVFIEYYYLLNGDLDCSTFLEKYQFDYLVVSKMEVLYSYLKDDSSYDIVFEDKDRFLFKRNV